MYFSYTIGRYFFLYLIILISSHFASQVNVSWFKYVDAPIPRFFLDADYIYINTVYTIFLLYFSSYAIHTDYTTW